MVTDTRVLIRTIKKMYPVVTFFKDRYFPDGKVFYAQHVLIEMKKKGRKVAPFVVPVVDGIPMKSEGYKAKQLDAPYIVPKMAITGEDLEKKAFGESPETNRTPADRENEIQAEHMDDMREAIYRRMELMCTQIITTGSVLMKHFSTAEDAANDEKYDLKYFQYYDGEFKNKYLFTKDFRTMTAQEKIMEFYKIAAILRKRGVRATDIVMTSDVSMILMTDPEFLEYYDKKRVDTGDIKQEELPEGVAKNGTVNINGVVMTMFTYDCEYEDLDGEVKEFLPAGTIAFLHPNMGETLYAQVTFVKNGSFHSYADKVVPRVVADEKNNLIEVQEFSRPVPYPFDVDSWIVCNINSPVVDQTTADNAVDTDEDPQSGVDMKSEDEIRAMTKKADVISYAVSIGLSGLSDTQSLSDLKESTIAYQLETYGE